MILTASKAPSIGHKAKIATAGLCKVYLTKEGAGKLRKEYCFLVEKRLPKIQERISEIREEGGEEYLSLLGEVMLEQEMVENRIEEIVKVLRNMGDLKPNGDGHVSLGSKVRVKIDKRELILEIVESIEADPLKSKVSYCSPVGQALIGAAGGETVEVAIPNGKMAYQVLEIL